MGRYLRRRATAGRRVPCIAQHARASACGPPRPCVLAFVAASMLLVEGTVAQGDTCVDSGPDSLVFTLLVVYFCTTMGLGLMICLIRSVTSASYEPLKRPPSMAVESGGGEHAPSAPVERGISSRFAEPDGPALESWQIRYSELRFGRKVGSGNVGEVYAARWRGAHVAVKRLLGNWYHDEEMVERFRDEILMLSTCRHTNVLRFVGAVMDVEAGNMCLVTELCVGSLEDVLHSEQKLSWQQRLKFMIGICDGMHYLHRRAGIIQRDLKSANVLVDDQYTPKIADFGLSRYMPEALTDAMTTYCGTPATMAPEIYQQKDYSEKADVFSFAIIMWEILTREEPYGRVARQGLRLAHMVAVEGLRPPIPAYCPKEWADLMRRMWDADEHKRPGFDEVLDILQPMLRVVDDKMREESRRAALQRGSSTIRFRPSSTIVEMVKEEEEGELEADGSGDSHGDVDVTVAPSGVDGGSVLFFGAEESKHAPDRQGSGSGSARSQRGSGSFRSATGSMRRSPAGGVPYDPLVLPATPPSTGAISPMTLGGREGEVARVLHGRGKVASRFVAASPYSPAGLRSRGSGSGSGNRMSDIQLEPSAGSLDGVSPGGSSASGSPLSRASPVPAGAAVPTLHAPPRRRRGSGVAKAAELATRVFRRTPSSGSPRSLEAGVAESQVPGLAAQMGVRREVSVSAPAGAERDTAPPPPRPDGAATATAALASAVRAAEAASSGPGAADSEEGSTLPDGVV